MVRCSLRAFTLCIGLAAYVFYVLVLVQYSVSVNTKRSCIWICYWEGQNRDKTSVLEMIFRPHLNCSVMQNKPLNLSRRNTCSSTPNAIMNHSVMHFWAYCSNQPLFLLRWRGDDIWHLDWQHKNTDTAENVSEQSTEMLLKTVCTLITCRKIKLKKKN